MNTPTKTRGVGAGKAADLTYWEGAARMIASVSTSSKIVVEKSTVPVKTAEAIEKASTALPVRWEDHYFLMPFPHGADAATVSAGVPTLMQPDAAQELASGFAFSCYGAALPDAPAPVCYKAIECSTSEVSAPVAVVDRTASVPCGKAFSDHETLPG